MNVSKKEMMTWINALRSGEYTQTTNRLQDKNGHCCLGVACEIFVPEGDKARDNLGFMYGTMPGREFDVPDWLKLIDKDFAGKTTRNLTSLNDCYRLNFEEISDLLQAVYIEGALDETNV